MLARLVAEEDESLPVPSEQGNVLFLFAAPAFFVRVYNLNASSHDDARYRAGLVLARRCILEWLSGLFFRFTWMITRGIGAGWLQSCMEQGVTLDACG